MRSVLAAMLFGGSLLCSGCALVEDATRNGIQAMRAPIADLRDWMIGPDDLPTKPAPYPVAEQRPPAPFPGVVRPQGRARADVALPPGTAPASWASRLALSSSRASPRSALASLESRCASRLPRVRILSTTGFRRTALLRAQIALGSLPILRLVDAAPQAASGARPPSHAAYDLERVMEQQLRPNNPTGRRCQGRILRALY